MNPERLTYPSAFKAYAEIVLARDAGLEVFRDGDDMDDCDVMFLLNNGKARALFDEMPQRSCTTSRNMKRALKRNKKASQISFYNHNRIIQPQTQGYCIEEERKALLQIKASYIKSYDSNMDHFLPTWVDYDNRTPGNSGGQCCDWERVNCNRTTGHVTHLSLYRLRGLNMYMEDWSKLWQLNISLFLHFKELRSLNLSDDFLDKYIMKTELEKLSSLKKLED
ncbi:hypothetical protein L1887_20021 [Cichorium endivia]|nr:hypothetical protein L1887_20021 [Cichorium endivia]